MGDATRDRDLLQVLGEKAGVQVKSVAYALVVIRMLDLPRRPVMVDQGAAGRQGVGAVPRSARRFIRAAVLEEIGARPAAPDVHFDAVEGVDELERPAGLVVVPVGKTDPQLEGPVAAPQELVLVDRHVAQPFAHQRDRRLAHADGADLRRLDDRDLNRRAFCATAELGGEIGRRHPTGRAAADNRDVPDWARHGSNTYLTTLDSGKS